jgi:Flp pilus assembly pilin Flp
MKSFLWAIYRDDRGEDSAEHAIVFALLALIVLVYAKRFTCNRIVFAVAVLSTPNGSVSGTVDAIIQVGEERNRLLHQLRSALIAGNDSDALQLARCYCGLVNKNEEKGRTVLQG